MDITEKVIASFREAVSVFSDTTKWSNDTILNALEESDAETGGAGWGSFVDEGSNFKRRGMFQYAAHWLAVTYPKGESVLSASPKYAVQSKTVGDESTSYNTGNLSQMSVGDSWLASTSFGQQFLRLRKRAGRGARAV